MSKRTIPEPLSDEAADAARGGAAVPSHTPDWTNLRAGDPGAASAGLTAHEAAHALQQTGKRSGEAG